MSIHSCERDPIDSNAEGFVNGSGGGMRYDILGIALTVIKFRFEDDDGAVDESVVYPISSHFAPYTNALHHLEPFNRRHIGGNLCSSSTRHSTRVIIII
jgi:hypothetical protein